MEIAFFARWWREQDAAMKADVRKLVEEGRSDFLADCSFNIYNVRYRFLILSVFFIPLIEMLSSKFNGIIRL